jgi:hypothetical protein
MGQLEASDQRPQPIHGEEGDDNSASVFICMGALAPFAVTNATSVELRLVTSRITRTGRFT